MTVTTRLGANDPVSAHAKSYGDYAQLLTDRNTPTPPSLTSESSPESYHDQEDSVPEPNYASSPLHLRHPSAAPSEDDFLNDWRALSSSAAFSSSLAEMSQSKMPQSGTFPLVVDESEQKFMPGALTDNGESKQSMHAAPHPMDAELPAHTWFHDTMPMSMDARNKGMYGVLPGPGSSTTTMPGMFSLRDMQTNRDEAMFHSMIEENHCAPPAAFEAMSMSNNSSNSMMHPASQGTISQESNSIAPGMLDDSSHLHRAGPSAVAAGMAGAVSVADPDLGTSAMHVIRPNRNQLPQDMEIHVHGVPATGAKSRVETQIRMRIELVVRGAKVEDGNPTWERIGSFGHIKVPPLSGTKRKSKKHQKVNVPSESLLLLEADVVNATPPHARVYVCNSCRERERKRAHRKKSKKLSASVHPTEEEMRALDINPELPNASELAAERMEEEERKHAVLFNCGDYIDFHDGEAVLSTRITCYCRHHREKLGFRIVFTLRDSHGEFVATGATPPIMIMDDHKSVTQSAAAQRPARPTEAYGPPQVDYGSEDSTQMNTTSPKGVYMTPAGLANRARERPKPYDERRRLRGGKDHSANGAPMDPSSMSFLLDSSRNFLWNSMPGENGRGTSPATSTSSNVMPDALNAQLGSVSPASVADSANMLATPLSIDMLPPNHMSGMAMDPLFSSPPQERNETLPALETPAPASDASVPHITKMIPAEGPTTGGIEITVLGENFTEGLQCVFGDTPSTCTRVWASTTLVCLLPPRFRPGPVIVSLQHGAPTLGSPVPNQPLQLFTYIDATDRALMELALQVVGLQMTGQMASARDVAMRIVHSSQGDSSGSFDSKAPQAQDEGEMLNVSELLAYGLRLCAQRNAPRSSIQDSILGFLSLMDVELDSADLPKDCVPCHDAIHACNAQGHTLLHLAVLLNYNRLTSDLLKRGCPINAQDVNGFTPLHFASLHGSLAITRLLLDHGATPYVTNYQGLRAIDVARRSDMIDTEQILAEYMAESNDEPGYSDASESESEDEEEEEERTPTSVTRAMFEQDDEVSDAESDASEDAGISFAELAALQRAAQTSEDEEATPSSSPRNSWHFGLLRRMSPKAIRDRHDSWLGYDTPKSENKPAMLTESAAFDKSSNAPTTPPQIQSPPPTYDEATLDDESGTSRHVLGEKLVTSQEGARLRERKRTDEARTLKLHGSASGSRLRQRTRRTAKEATDEANPYVRQRLGVYDDHMLLWFWIPAMIAVFLLTVVLNNGSFLSHDTPTVRVASVST